jgi:hypothetical protein
MRWGNILIGGLGLALLQGLVSGQGAQNVGGFVAGAGRAVAWFVDPTVPAFKNTTQPNTTPAPSHPLASAAATPISPVMGQSAPFPGESPQTVAQGGAV